MDGYEVQNLENQLAQYQRDAAKALERGDHEQHNIAIREANRVMELLDANRSVGRAVKADPASSYRVGDSREFGGPGAFGRYARAIRAAAYGRATDADRSEIERRAIVGAGEAIPGIGGFLVDKPIANEIVNHAQAGSLLASKATIIPITIGNGTKIPCVDVTSEADGSRPLRGYWLDEGGQITASVPAWKSETYDVKTLAILCPATDALLEDAPAFESWLVPAAGREFSYCLDRAVYRGTGAGSPLGWINAPCAISVAAEDAQAAATVLAENLLKMRKRRLPLVGLNYMWVYSPSIEDQLQLLVHPAANTPLWVNGGTLANTPYDTILGHACYPFVHCSAAGTVGDIALIAPSDYYLAQKGGMRSDTSIHMYYDTVQTAFRFLMRVDGQPSLPAPVAPELSPTNTFSTCLTLAARS